MTTTFIVPRGGTPTGCGWRTEENGYCGEPPLGRYTGTLTVPISLSDLFRQVDFDEWLCPDHWQVLFASLGSALHREEIA